VQKVYIDQLRSKMWDCERITEEEWEFLDYRVYSLKKIIKKFNECTQNTKIVVLFKRLFIKEIFN
jgi:hypothetical protein